MKLTRLILGCTLLLLASVPLFALPVCGECIQNECVDSSWSGTPCTYDQDGNCITYLKRCSTPFVQPVLAEWTVASIEVSRPAAESKTVATPAAEEANVSAATESN